MHLGQAKAWNSRKRFVFVLAGTQGGKTSWGPWWLWREIYGCGDYAGRGAGDYLGVTASYDLFKLKMLPVLRETFEHALDLGRYWSSTKIIELRPNRNVPFTARRVDDAMWARIILRSCESSGGLESSTAKAAWLDEVGQDNVTLEDWEAVQRRISLEQGRVLGTTTVYNRGWLKSQIYDPFLNGDPDFDIIQFDSTENPAFPREEYERARRTLPTWRFEMFYRGRFSRPAGLIYADFDESTMLVDPFLIPDEWPKVVGVDFGGANTATLWLALDPRTGRWYAYRETLEGGRSTPEHAHDARDALGRCREFVFAGGAPGETQQRMDWTAAGIEVLQPLVSDVEAGLSRVTSLIKSNNFRVFRTCKGLRDEIGSYRRKIAPDGETLDEIMDKRKFHRLDCLRYIAPAIVGELPEERMVYNSDIRVHVGY